MMMHSAAHNFSARSRSRRIASGRMGLRSTGDLQQVKGSLRIIEAQRGVAACQGGQDEPAHGVGGFAQLTLFGRDRINTRVMQRWPDRIGEQL